MNQRDRQVIEKLVSESEQISELIGDETQM